MPKYNENCKKLAFYIEKYVKYALKITFWS